MLLSWTGACLTCDIWRPGGGFARKKGTSDWGQLRIQGNCQVHPYQEVYIVDLFSMSIHFISSQNCIFALSIFVILWQSYRADMCILTYISDVHLDIIDS